jgi:hypothetical protein
VQFTPTNLSKRRPHVSPDTRVVFGLEAVHCTAEQMFDFAAR